MRKIATYSLSLCTAIVLAACAGTSTSTPSGSKQVQTPAAELMAIKNDLNRQGVIADIGIGESSDEMAAMSIANDEGRKGIATTLGTEVKRFSEQYLQNVSGDAKKIFEEKTNQLTVEFLRGTSSAKVVNLYNEEKQRYTCYTLMVLDPKVFAQQMEQVAKTNEEIELRVKSSDMQARMERQEQLLKEKLNP